MSATLKTAMVLTAGLGTRLNPISQKIPKPLVSVLNVPNILHVLFMLKKAGVQNVVMNLFHLSEKMEAFFSDQNFFDINFSFTYEDPILGTGGGVKNAEHLLRDSQFILANCDFVSNLDIRTYIEKHQMCRSMASMLLIQDESKQHLYSKVGVDEKERLVSLPKLKIQNPTQQGIFTGVHLLNSKVLEFLDSKPCGINDTLYPKLMKEFPDAVHGFVDKSAFWYDTGDLPAFLLTSRALLERLNQRDKFIIQLFQSLDMKYEEIRPGVWIEEGTNLDESVQTLGPALISKNSVIGKKSKIGPFIIVGNHCQIGEGSALKESIFLPGSTVEANSDLSHVIQFENQSLGAKAIV